MRFRHLVPVVLLVLTQLVLSQEREEEDRLTTLVIDLRRSADANEHSLHRLVRQLGREVSTCSGRVFDEVRAALDHQGVKGFEHRKHQFGDRYACRVLDEAFATPSGLAFELRLELDCRNETSATDPTKSMCSSASAVLRATPDMLFSRIAAERPFPKGSAIDVVLDHARVTAAAEKYPVLHRVELSYSIVMDRWAPTWPHAFSVVLTLHAVKGDDGRGKQMRLTVVSGLDAPIDPSDPDAVPEGFISKDVLGDVRSWGGSEWGPAAPERHRVLELAGFRNGGGGWPRAAATVRGGGDLLALPVGTSSVRIEGEEFRDEDLAHLARLTKLGGLELADTFAITPKGLATLGRIAPSLRWLQVGVRRKLDDAALAAIGTLEGLEQLSVSWCSGFSAGAFRHLAGLKNLTRLSLGWCDHLDDEGVKAIVGAMPRLRSLRLWGAKDIGDEALRHIGGHGGISSLTMSHAEGITPGGFAHLAKTKLVHVTVGYHVPLGDAGLAHLAKVGNLRWIELRGATGFTDEGLGALKALPLGRLEIHDCPWIPAAALNALRAELGDAYSIR